MKRLKRTVQASDEDYELEEKFAQIASSYNYKLNYASVDNKGFLMIDVRPASNNKYAPSIEYVEKGDYETDGFRINAKSFGSQTLDEFAEMLEAYNSAYEMCSEMSDMIDLIGVEPGVTIREYA